MRPVCVKCGKEMRCERNGFVVYHLYKRPTPGPISEKIAPDVTLVHADRLLKYSPDRPIDFLVKGDMYQCPDCGHQVVTGFGRPFTDYEDGQAKLKKILTNARDSIEILR